jgi:hypothetical protein
MLTLSGAGQPQNGGAGIEERFVISVKTDNAGTSADNEFTLPWIGTYDIDWGDGTSDTGVVDTQTHTYASAGTYDVAVTANTGQIYFARANNDRRKLLDIKNWGTCAWTTMRSAFTGCEKLEGVSAMDIPNFTNCTDTSGMFQLAAYSTPAKITNLINWDVSNITNMANMFEGYKRYSNTDLTEGTINFSNWDFSNVTNMRNFATNSRTIYGILDCTNTSITNLTDGYQSLRSVNVSNIGSLTVGNTFPGGAKLVDATLSNLDISNTTNFYTAFAGNNFPSGITFDSWDFSHVTSMRDMFADCTNIPDVTGLDVSSVSNFQYMFSRSSDFNQDISVWDVSGPGSMRGMLYGTTNFDRSLANWDISGITDFRDFMNGATLSTANYDSTLISWASQNVSLNESISFGNSRYTVGGAAEAARDILVNTYGWTITDGGGYNVPVSGLLFDYPNPERAYSLRQLAGYGGGLEIPVIRVRRASDNTEQDFTANQITDGTLTTFTGINDGFVVKVYDQSNIFPISQTTANRQAKIVNAGSLLLENGKPTMTTIAGYDYVYGDSTLDYYTNKDTFTYTINKLDSSLTNNNEVFIDNAGGAFQGRTGFSLASNYARINYNGTISSISYDRYLTEDILQPLVWESYPADSVLNNRLKLYNQNGLLADGNVSNTTPTGQGSTRWLTFFGAEGGTYLAPEGNWQETILYKEENIPNRDNFLTSIDEYYNFPPTSGLLADYPGASAAYSLRNLANNVTNVVRVRRSSDNTEQDFTSAEITDGTLATFCSGTDGFVAIWYDQSGNSNNASTPVALQQYLIVDNGVIYMSDGKPAIVNLNSSNKFLGWNEFTAVTVISVSKQVGAYGKLQCLFSRNYGNNTANERAIRRDDQSPYQNWTVVGNTQDWFVPANGDWYSNNILKTSDYTNPDTELLFLTNAGSQTYSISRIGDGGSTGRSIKSAIQEVIIYPTDQSGNRTGIEENINAKYTIY